MKKHGREKRGGSNKKVTNGLVALSSAAVLTVYSAGYLRTRAAADRFAVSAAARRPAPPTLSSVAEPVAAISAPPAIRSTPAVPSPASPPSAPSAPEPKAVASAPASVASVPSTPAASSTPLLPSPKAPAPAPAAAPPPASAPAAAEGPTYDPSEEPYVPRGPYKDGTYLGWGYSRHGDIQASVEIQNGHIASAVIAQCLTRYSCDVIEKLPPQVAKRQSPEVDLVSGATESADAFYGAVVDALSKAK
jgi:uncharacterized protein with FMN-binding domain